MAEHTGSPDELAKAFAGRTLSLSSRAVHADDFLNAAHQDVAPPLHVSTTFRYPRDPDALQTWDKIDPTDSFDYHIYSRDSTPNTTRLEAILSNLLGGPSIAYSSGLSAFHAMIVFLNPRRVAIGGGYHGCHGVLDLLHKLNGLEQIDLLDEAALSKLQPGDVVHVETPVNPTGEALDIQHYAKIAHDHGAYLTVDATFAPPPLQNPLDLGADIVMHSGTKYFGGHSDMLLGVLVVHPKHATAQKVAPKSAGNADAAKSTNWVGDLLKERLVLGSVAGGLEGWLGVRSVRTLELRVTRQSASAARLVAWLEAERKKEGSVVNQAVDSIKHASLQPEAADKTSWLQKQMPGGYGPVFSVLLRSQTFAKRLPSKLHLFHHATSLGGVESLIEWRAMTDPTVDTRLVRISIGVEDAADIQADLEAGFKALLAEAK